MSGVQNRETTNDTELGGTGGLFDDVGCLSGGNVDGEEGLVVISVRGPLERVGPEGFNEIHRSNKKKTDETFWIQYVPVLADG